MKTRQLFIQPPSTKNNSGAQERQYDLKMCREEIVDALDKNKKEEKMKTTEKVCGCSEG